MPVTRFRAPRQGAGDATLLLMVAGAPPVVAGRVGRGRVVAWLVSPKVWLPQCLGHAHGLDDLSERRSCGWRGSPVMKAMPPEVAR